MTRLQFRNCLAILRSIDRHELVEAGAIGADDFTMWNTFLNNPEQFFLLCEDHRAEKIWRVIERRAMPDQVNWNDHSQAAKALRAGAVPPGCSINEAGALVVPETQEGQFVRGSSLILAYFDRIVTTSGRIVKDRDGFLQAARAL